MEKYLIEKIDWDAYRKNLENSIENEKIWSLGATGDENPHEENIENLQDELEYIVDGQYEAIVGEKFKVMGNDAVNYFYDFFKDKKELIDMIDWDVVYGDIESSINNEQMWAAGSYEHAESVNRLEHFLQCIDNEDYQQLLDYYGTEYFIKDYLYTGEELQQKMKEQREDLLLDSLADIAMYAGWQHLEFEDSKLRSITLRSWAEEFTDLHAHTDWEKEDYINLVDEFAEKKVNHWLKLHPLKPSYTDRISDIHVYSGPNARTFIRCKIDGEQQTAVQLSFADAVNFNDRTDRMTLAARYFKDALDTSQERGKTYGR